VTLEDINKKFPVMAVCGASVMSISVVIIFKGAKKSPQFQKMFVPVSVYGHE